MVAYNFKPQFAPDVRARRKKQTIRAKAKAKVGDAIQLYTGMRTTSCEKLVGEDATCIAVQPVVVAEDYIAVDGWRLPSGDQMSLANADGFLSIDSFKAFFRDHYGLPFSGWLTKWDWPPITEKEPSDDR